MANKGLAFSLGGVKRPQAAKLQLGLAKPSKGNALAAFDTPDSDDDTQTPVQQAKRQRTEPAGYCASRLLFVALPLNGYVATSLSAVF